MLKFWKYESIGNDFPLVHLGEIDGRLDQLAIRLSDRRLGVGGDGLLAVGIEGEDLRLRMFNPDGTEDFCGNGLRCAALHAHRQGWVGNSFTIRHLGESVGAHVEGSVIRITVNAASFVPDEIPVKFEQDPENTFDRVVWSDSSRSLRGSVLSTGTTHTVIPGPLPEWETVSELGSIMERAPQFPARTSVIWYENLEPDAIAIRIWERGAGITEGCGTGSAAAAVDYMRRAGHGGVVAVRNPGGVIKVGADRWDSPLWTEGPATEVFTGVIRL